MHEIIKERLQFILQHAAAIEERIKDVDDVKSLMESKAGQILLDSLITRLQALCENSKRIQKVDPAFFHQYLPLDVTPMIRFRDLASHHYESLNYIVIYGICKGEVLNLRRCI